MSVRRRLALLFTIGTAISLVLSCSALFVILNRELSAAIDNGLRARLGDLEAVARRTDGGTDDHDPFAQVVRPDGTVLAWSPGDQATRSALTMAQLASVHRDQFFDVQLASLGGSSRVLARPIQLGSRQVILVVGSPLDVTERAQRGLALVLLVVAPLLVILVASAGWWLAGAALRPVHEMTDEVNAITSVRQLDRRLSEPPGGDEVADLARTLNAMLARMQGAVERERSFVDDASHELRTPISILQGELELLRAAPDDPAGVVSSVDRALDDLDRLRRLTERLLALSRVDAGQAVVRRQTFELRDRTQRLGGALSEGSGHRFVVAGPEVRVSADPDMIDQILANLLSNAHRHATRQVRITLAVEGEDGARLEVEDDGPGFAPSLLPVRFERFARADASRTRSTGGTGLGLAVAAALISAMGGSITADNESALGGARISVRLPGSDPKTGLGASQSAQFGMAETGRDGRTHPPDSVLRLGAGDLSLGPI